MKTLFIPCISKNKTRNIAEITKKLPSTLYIIYSIQYKKAAESIKKELGKRVKISGFKQVLGCSSVNSKDPVLLIGSGKFHALNIAVNNFTPIYIYDNGKLSIISKQDIQKFKQKQKAKLSRFYSSENIGIIISNKPGQKRLPQAIQLKLKLAKKYPEKTFSLFIADTLNLQELENFSIDFWINTACPGIEQDSNLVLNYKNIK